MEAPYTSSLDATQTFAEESMSAVNSPLKPVKAAYESFTVFHSGIAKQNDESLFPDRFKSRMYEF